MDIQNKVVIITGASGGIGLATAREFARRKARLVLAARSTDKIEQLARELSKDGTEAIAVTTDMRRKADVEAMVQKAVERFGTVDVLVNNAGQTARGRVDEVDPAHWEQIIQLNLYGVLYAMQAVIPIMRKAGGGVIVNISSMTSKMILPRSGLYSATKSALNQMSQTARVELEPENIRVLLVYPRMTATDFGKNAIGVNAQMPSRGSGHAPVIDPPEHVAKKIAEAVENESPEQFME